MCGIFYLFIFHLCTLGTLAEMIFYSDSIPYGNPSLLFIIMMIRFLTFSCCLLGAVALSAQFHGGVKTGLNFSTLKGSPEADASGAVLESVDNLIGFHIGPSFSYNFTDRFGVRGELLYSKKGAKYTYTGPGSRTFILENNLGTVRTNGSIIRKLETTHVNMDIPVSAFVRLGDFEFSAGVYASLIFQKTGTGALKYTWEAQPGTIGGEFESFLDYNYNRDDPGQSKGTENIAVTVQQDPDGTNQKIASLPKTLGAYYDNTEDHGNLYKNLDYGVSAGLSYYFSRSLFFGGRLQYGLADLTKSEADFSLQSLNQTTPPVTRNDKDYNFTIQVSVGFSF